MIRMGDAPARHVAMRPPGRVVLVRMQQDKAKERTDAQVSQLSILLTLACVLRESCAPALQPQCISAQCYLLSLCDDFVFPELELKRNIIMV